MRGLPRHIALDALMSMLGLLIDGHDCDEARGHDYDHVRYAEVDVDFGDDGNLDREVGELEEADVNYVVRDVLDVRDRDILGVLGVLDEVRNVVPVVADWVAAAVRVARADQVVVRDVRDDRVVRALVRGGGGGGGVRVRVAVPILVQVAADVGPLPVLCRPQWYLH